MEITINGQVCHPLDPKETLHHEALCLMSGRATDDAKVDFVLPDGTVGSVERRGRAPLVDGAAYTVSDAS